MAMMASAASDPFNNSFDEDNDLLETDPLDGGETRLTVKDDLNSDCHTEIEPDVPTSYSTSDRAPLTGNIQSSQNPVSQNRGYLNSAIPGEDRRAPQNTIDESVWETVSRDLFAVWEKMKQVLWPKYLLGGVLNRAEGGDVESQGFGRDLRGLVGRWPAMVDADGILQGGMSEGLRDWDLWGPLIFCLLLSMFLSMRAPDKQTDHVFAGVFSIIWIGEAVVTLQIKLLGGNMCAVPLSMSTSALIFEQILHAVGQHHRLHPLSPRYCVRPQRGRPTNDCPDSGVHCACTVVIGGGSEYTRRLGSREESSWASSLPVGTLLHRHSLSLFYYIDL
jgi:hypothetical protein